MKRTVMILSCVFISVSIVFCSGIFKIIEAAHSENFIYTVNEDGKSVTITEYTGLKCNVVIPDNINGKTVTAVVAPGFSFNTNITDIQIPSSVNTIGLFTFAGCNSLTNINVNDQNANYSSINGILFNKDKTDIVFMPQNKEGNYVVPNGVQTIKATAFIYCDKIKSITIPKSVESIEQFVFPSSENNISFSEIIVDEENQTYSSLNGVLFNKNKTHIICYPCAKQGDYAVPRSVRSIEEYTFQNCIGLTSVTIPNSVASIGSCAFQYCSNLTRIVIPSGITDIEFGSFFMCENLQSIVIPKTVTNISMSAFAGCNYIETVYFDGTYDEWEKIKISEGNEPLNATAVEYNYIREFLSGDINGDGYVDIIDLMRLKKYISGLADKAFGADINGDGNINSLDLIAFKKLILN